MQKIGIGYEDYKRIIEDHCYYVDKTLLCRDVIEKGGMVTLFTRPRRFGKTLAQTMLKTFFELEYDRNGNVIDKRPYFEGKRIMDADPVVVSMMGQYPVIFLSLKSAKQPDFRSAFLKLRESIVDEFRRHSYLASSDQLSASQKEEYLQLSSPAFEGTINTPQLLAEEISKYCTALKSLSAYLEAHHSKKVIILLDEYDVPLENAYYAGFYSEMTGFIRSLFESALKTNDSLQFSVITGCLRISRESIFTGLNHLVINSIRDSSFAEGFGFTLSETAKILEDYGLSDRKGEVQSWYDGYLFGDTEICNPWSIIKYIYGIVLDKKQFPEPYWANTSSNQIIKDMVEHADEKAKEELGLLIRGGTIEKKIHEDITYGDIHDNEDNLWNFLFFTGYMKKVSERKDERDIYVTMKIPNDEILSIYENQISTWFEKLVEKSDHASLHRMVLEGDTDGIAEFISSLLRKSISTFDNREGFYHGFFLSLLYGVPNYSVRSNREAGIGRPDIILYPNRPTDPAIIFEVKVRSKFSEMQDGLEEAYRQIRDQHYADGILEEGYIGSVAYGICFCKKSCIVGKYTD